MNSINKNMKLLPSDQNLKEKMEKQAELREVVLLGTWASSYCKRVELALKVKGIGFEYLEQDLTNKSELLLTSNPVHKKVPVLLHNGKSIAESLVILEYIDECWKNSGPRLLPEDPYLKARARSWADFHDQKQEKAIEDFNGLLTVFEKGIKEDFPSHSPFLGGQNLGFLDIVVGTHVCNFKAFEEAVVVVVDPNKYPHFVSWIYALKDHPLMKETLPPHEKLVAAIRAKFFQSP
ncbi:Glutathione S-transferase TAU 10 [Tripterygium wilfordii]|uniref:Glutathione S-transferase n=1 Tax=Tripterygium wilfordii TaxID=458696 RepID=A0A7J7D692_TRIWF|nr:Glutathione S-transferase TAU 10 [Tripterygium wilfordii]